MIVNMVIKLTGFNVIFTNERRLTDEAYHSGNYCNYCGCLVNSE